jgi:AraC family transcriptional regulator, transcriptional activator of pobA
MMSQGKSVSTSHPDRRRYELVIEKYLKDCYRQRTAARVSELAHLLHAPRPYLSRVIPQLFGKPLRAVLRERQLEEAKRLLRVTSLSVDDIAAASAFGDPTTFFRCFRTAAGMTPAQYRYRSRDEK